MKYLFMAVMVSVIALVVYASVDWTNLDLSLPTSPEETAIVSGQNYNEASSEDSVENDRLWIDTVMFAKGHAFGYSGDISMWGGWYLDTIFVGDDRMLQYDSIAPSKLKLSLITRELIVDLGEKNVAYKIRSFMNPIKGFKRFQQNYEECLDSVTDEEYGTWKYMGEFSFTVDYPDSGYEYDRIGTGHEGYTETFHTFDFTNGNELTNTDIFKNQYLDKVKMALFEVMAEDPHYRVWNGDSISPAEIQGRIEGWQSPDSILKGTEWQEPEREVKFELPDGALTNFGVVFSFQPYEIDCWAAGTYHFIVSFKKLLPYMTAKAKRLIGK